MIIYYLNKPGLKIPFRANPTDKGFDIFAASGPKIIGEQISDELYKNVLYVEYGTDLFVHPKPNGELNTKLTGGRADPLYSLRLYDLEARPRSSVSKYNLILANSPATIDESYRGEIKIRFKYIFQPEDFRLYNFDKIGGKVNKDKIYNIGDRIVQILPSELHQEIAWVGTDELDSTDRGDGGFGSTGK